MTNTISVNLQKKSTTLKEIQEMVTKLQDLGQNVDVTIFGDLEK